MPRGKAQVRDVWCQAPHYQFSAIHYARLVQLVRRVHPRVTLLLFRRNTFVPNLLKGTAHTAFEDSTRWTVLTMHATLTLVHRLPSKVAADPFGSLVFFGHTGKPLVDGPNCPAACAGRQAGMKK